MDVDARGLQMPLAGAAPRPGHAEQPIQAVIVADDPVAPAEISADGGRKWLEWIDGNRDRYRRRSGAFRARNSAPPKPV